MGKPRTTTGTKTRTDGDLRSDLQRRIMRMLAKDGLVRDLRVRDSEGVAPLVFALDDELLSAVVGRVMIAGGSANTFVEMADARIMMLAVTSADDGVAPDLGEGAVHQDITIGMFVEVCRQHPDGVTAKISLPRHSAEVGEVRELQPA